MNQEQQQHAWESISAWRDGELSPVDAEAVARRVAEDADWTTLDAELAALDESLDCWDAPAPPEELADRICTAARFDAPSRPNRWSKWALVTSTAAAILIAVIVLQDVPKGPADTTARVPEAVLRDGLPLFQNMDVASTEKIDPLVEAVGETPDWRELEDGQREVVRLRAMAFLQMAPEEQRVVLAGVQQRSVTAVTTLRRQQQLRWVRVVMESFSPAEQEELRLLAPPERMKRFLARREKLIADGVLSTPKE